MDQVTCHFGLPPSLKMVQPTPLECGVFLCRFRTTHISPWRKERQKYRVQAVTGVPKVIEHILQFCKGQHLSRDEESVIIQDGLDGQPFPEGGSKVLTLQPESDLLRQAKREREAKKQAKDAQQVIEKRHRTLDAFCVAAPPRADVASSIPVSLNPLNLCNVMGQSILLLFIYPCIVSAGAGTAMRVPQKSRIAQIT